MKLKIRKTPLAIACICFLFAFCISMQFKSVRRNTIIAQSTTMRYEDMATNLIKLQERNEDLQTRLEQAESDLLKIQNQTSENNGLTKILQEKLDRSEVLAGTVDVEGPGIIVILNDSKKNSQTGFYDESLIVHDTDVRDVVNELKASGAEAISVNDQRITSTSTIRCVGPTIVINDTKLAPPFTINAIGNPDTLEAGLKIKDGIVSLLTQASIQVDIKKTNKLFVKKYEGVITNKYAIPVKKEDSN